ncbi:MAG: peptidoglycan DD-metalloendopeptidase family protein [Sedimenticolaceae bacterium]
MGLLTAALLAVKYLDLDAFRPDLSAHAGLSQPLATPLALPGPAQGALDARPRETPAELTLAPEPVPEPDAQAQEISTEITTIELPLDQTASEPAPSLLEEATREVQASVDASPEEPLSSQMDEAEVIVAKAETPGDNLRLGLVVASPPPEAEAQPRWTEHRVVKGESLARIFDLQGLDARLLHEIINSSKEAKSLAQIRPGQKLRFQFDDNHELTRLELHRNRVESIRIAIADDEITIEEVSKAVEKRVASAAGVIESSLFADGQKAGLSDGQIMELAAIFGWDIDFALEIRAGDQFRVLYEEHFLDGEKLRNGPILAAEFTNRSEAYKAVRYEDRNGEVGYFDVDGKSKRRAFIRTPIKFARVSSRYNPKRWHPVLKKWRSHKGVDYAAPKGTPVKATGDGRVIHRGTKGGYGRTVIIEHAGKYTTLYAHLSGYSKRAKTGNRVKQGQVIGYVGKSGLATGPHLHYEFRVSGQHRDPLRVKLPKSLSLPKSEIAEFHKAVNPLLTQLAAIPADTMIASSEVATRR